MATERAPSLPPEMFSFVLRHGDYSKAGLRLGQLTVQGRSAISTPSLVIPTSRGVIPHITQDTVSKLTRLSAVYVALEDFIERSPSKSPIFRQNPSPPNSKLRDFIALPDQCLSILGPRRIPAIETPNQNSNSSIAICTSVGFQLLNVDDYVQSAQDLGPDITIGPADIVTTKQVSQKRMEKSADRTHAWTRDTLAVEPENKESALFASLPPLEPQRQSFYLSDLTEEYKGQVAGLSTYSAETAASLQNTLEDLPRLCLNNPINPHELLRVIALGNDLVTTPFVTETSENGIAMDFRFAVSYEARNQKLGIDLWDNAHATDVSPLVKGCGCYTCTKHHRAYLHHLLSAKEMLAWTLLQIHNFSIMEDFFEAIRESVRKGTFEEQSKAFARAYDPEMPRPTGEGPRIRGYQMKSVGGGEPKKNRKVYGRLDEQARKLEEAESGIATPEEDVNAKDIEKLGLGEVQN
ncbi:hypothetical protein LTR05_005463 [Lithohypha guttulata]|uniref:Queuine tRNA-ribosyltransferase accessory subunit 2 n=1 Tax=Lithohypha guttulata TaxID=1690604 RepID=A0AAN7Y5H6_9EURO|nr:hypothetical protein LTR05_005463 [Lithohypha guttulata]